MIALARTPSIAVTVGRSSRLFNLYLTTAPVTLDAPSTITLHAASLDHIANLADVPLSMDAANERVSSRLVLIDVLELDWQRRTLKEHGYRLIEADPLLLRPDSLERWLWQRLQSGHLRGPADASERRQDNSLRREAEA